MTKKMLFIFNPHSGKGQIKNHLLDILDKFAKAEYDAWWELWEKEGWINLGRTRNYDWMHVQATR